MRPAANARRSRAHSSPRKVYDPSVEGAEKRDGTETRKGGRRLLAAGALVTAAGLALTGSAAPALGAVIVVAGWVLLAYGLHVFGRAGAA
jgi:hypothetical protein